MLSGVEIEIQVVDPETGKTSTRYGEKIFKNAQANDQIVNEFFLCQVETITRPWETVSDVVDELREIQGGLYDDLRQEGLSPIHTGTHPIESGIGLPVTQNPRYINCKEEFGEGIQDSLITGLHLNIDTKYPVEMTYLLLQHVPMSVAVNPNSPLWHGKPSGHMDLRIQRWEPMFKRVGFPPLTMKTVAQYESIVKTLMKNGLIDGPGSIWWLIRPKLDKGVVEIRTPSTPGKITIIGAYLALFTGLVHRYEHFLDQGMKLPKYTVVDELMRKEALFSAMKHGIDGMDWDYLNQCMVPMKESIEKTLKFASDSVDSLGTHKQFADLEEILNGPSDAQRQLNVYTASNNNVHAVVRYLIDESWMFFE